MSKQVAMAFDPEGISISIANILPLKTLPGSLRSSQRYLRIKATMAEVGIVEPPMVYPQKGKKGMYLMLDGHVLVMRK